VEKKILRSKQTGRRATYIHTNTDAKRCQYRMQKTHF